MLVSHPCSIRWILPVLLAIPVLGAGLPEVGVSHDLARDRARLISNLEYRYNVKLAKGAATMPGHASISFDLATAGPVVLDFRDGDARNMTVNGEAQPFGQTNGHLTIPGEHFRAGRNQIELDFESGIAVANRAITRYVDTQDGERISLHAIRADGCEPCVSVFRSAGSQGAFHAEG